MTDGVLAYALIPAAALLLDTLLGDPRSGMHPVVLIGRLISFLESLLYPAEYRTPGSLLFRGGLVVVLVVSITGGVAWGLLMATALGGPLCSALMGAVILYFTITPRALARDGLEIYHLLRKKNIVLARKRLSWIVGRDTDRLNEPDIARSCGNDCRKYNGWGFVSAVLFLLFGPVGAACYRAANTMDSMLGYKNERYLYFGRAAARLDDVLNYIPARITFILFVISSFSWGWIGKMPGRSDCGMRLSIRVRMEAMPKDRQPELCMFSWVDGIIMKENRNSENIWEIRTGRSVGKIFCIH